MFFASQPLHFVGIGGIGMSGLAEIAVALGCRVSGSDKARSETTDRLQSKGIRVSIGHAAENLGDAGAIVVTTAVGQDNPEVVEAKQRGLPIMRRGELLADLMRTRTGMAVGGSHGKTSTTGMAATIGVECGLDPMIVMGGRLPALGGVNAHPGKGPHLIAESDESDGSFLLLSPVVAIITNVDREHLDYYRDLADIRASFITFANRVPHYGLVVLCLDDPNAAGLRPEIRRRVLTYGRSEAADLRIVSSESEASGSRFHLTLRGQDIGEFHLPALGDHNVLNATAAIAASLELGLDADAIRQALARFGGVARRMEVKGRGQNITVVDDYGHHPTEIRATLKALRLANPARLVVLFQPHRYTRTRELMPEFTTAFGEADTLRIVDLYAASEPPIEGINSEALAEAIRAAGHSDVLWTGSLAGTVAHALTELRDGDLVVTLGAGNITEAGRMILKGLRCEAAGKE